MSKQPGTAGLTRQLAERAQSICCESLPADVRAIARHSILDFVGLAIASAQDPLIRILADEASALQGRPEASTVASADRVPADWAATINSAAGHVLAYDDVNMVVPGHGTAVAFPSAFALAETQGADGAAFMQAYVAAFETVCSIGAMVQPSHYDDGFHASATIGGFGAAAAAGKLLGLDTGSLTEAISIAASMAAGLKGNFGTMLKAFQVARAAGSGVLAARLARRGLSGRGNMVEAPQGFAATLSKELVPTTIPQSPLGYYVRETLYKYHAACYLAHSPIECALALRREGVRPDTIASVEVFVNPMCGKVCNIGRPTSAREIGYSIPTLVAMSLAGLSLVRAEHLTIPAIGGEIPGLREKIQVRFDEALSDTGSRIAVSLHDGARKAAERDVGRPETDLKAQGDKIRAKFRSLTLPLLGANRAEMLIHLIERVETLESLTPIAALMRPPEHPAGSKPPTPVAG